MKKVYSDRGSLKDLQHKSINQIENNLNEKPSSYELRMKKLYEYADSNKDYSLKESLGFITTNYISNKDSLPLSIYHLRSIVENIKSKKTDSINQFTTQLEECFKTSSVLSNEFYKKASSTNPVFRRVNDE